MLLEVNDITIEKSENVFLHNVSLDVMPGEILGMIGPNGAGKSLLTEAICGLCPVRSGQVLFDGRDITNASPLSIYQQGIALLRQNVNLCQNMSVAENIFLSDVTRGFFKKLSRKALYERADLFLQEAGYDIDSHTPVEDLSYENQRLVELFKALHSNCRLIILDEPVWSNVGDPAYHLGNILRRVAQQNIGMIVISHELSNIYRTCDSLITVSQETVSGKIPVSSLQEADLLTFFTPRTVQSGFHKFQKAPGKPMLTLEKISSESGLEDISLSVNQHEIVGIAGSSFSGKDRLIRLICGMERPTSGTMRFFTQPVAFRHPSEALENGICFLSQESTRNDIFENLTIPQNITITNLKEVFRLLRSSSKLEEDIADDLLEMLYTQIDPQQPVGTLSEGSQQKVRLARCLFANSRLLVLEAPTKGIDVISRFDFYNFMQNYVLGNAAIVISSDDIGELMSLCDRIFIMQHRRIVREIRRKDFHPDMFLEHTEDVTSILL